MLNLRLIYHGNTIFYINLLLYYIKSFTHHQNLCTLYNIQENHKNISKYELLGAHTSYILENKKNMPEALAYVSKAALKKHFLHE